MSNSRSPSPRKEKVNGSEKKGGNRSSELCRDYQRGHCKRGTLCPFVHKELPPEEREARFGSEICRDYQRGPCPRGSRCPYIHEREPCRDFVNGDCRRGNDCHYYHPYEYRERSPPRKRPRYELSPPSSRSHSSSRDNDVDSKYIKSLKEEVISLREDNKSLRDENRTLRRELNNLLKSKLPEDNKTSLK